MARIQNTILDTSKAPGNGLATTVDLKIGGQNGYMVDMQSIVANAGYVKRNIIPILLDAPRGFKDLPNPDMWVANLKNLVELHSQSIEGLTSTLSVEFAEAAIGGAGEMQEDIANVTRARTVPVFSWPEKYGKSVQAFLTGWIVNLMGDPETKVPRVVSLGGNKPTDLLPDYTGMTVLFIEPDPTQTQVIHAWLCTNMMPKTAGENTGKRDLTAAGEALVHSVEFTSITQIGAGVDQTAQKFLDNMNLTAVNPNNRPAFVDAMVADVESVETGYSEKVQAAAAAAVTPVPTTVRDQPE